MNDVVAKVRALLADLVIQLHYLAGLEKNLAIERRIRATADDVSDASAHLQDIPPDRRIMDNTLGFYPFDGGSIPPGSTK